MGKKTVAGIAITVLAAVAVTSCESQPEAPDDDRCDDWEWDSDTGAYYCDDNDSNIRGAYFFGKRLYKNKSFLKNSSQYKSSIKSGFGGGFKSGG